MIESLSYVGLLSESDILNLINYCIDSENACVNQEVYKKSHVPSVKVTKCLDDYGYFLTVIAGYRKFIIRDYLMTAEDMIAPYVTKSFNHELHLFMTRNFGGRYIDDVTNYQMNMIMAEQQRLIEELKEMLT